MNKLLPLTTLPLALTGCVNQFASMPDASVTDPIDYVEQYQAASEKGLLNPLAFVGGRDDGNNFRKYRKSWCAVSEDALYSLKDDLKDLCQNKGGELRGQWCVKSNSDTPLFKMHIAHSNMQCSTGTSSYAEVIAPINDTNTNDSKWIALAKNNGFETAAEIETAEKQRQTALEAQKIVKKQQALREQQRKEADRIQMLSTRGLRICQKAKYSYQGKYTGFVEDFTDKKIKVHVAHLGGDGWTASGFKESTIWDYPDNWYVCDR